MPAIPAAVATTSLLAASVLASPFSAGTSASLATYPDVPNKAYVHYVDTMNASTSSVTSAGQEPIHAPRESAKFAALDMFGTMRSSTAEERDLYEEMFTKISTPLDVDIFAL